MKHKKNIFFFFFFFFLQNDIIYFSKSFQLHLNSSSFKFPLKMNSNISFEKKKYSIKKNLFQKKIFYPKRFQKKNIDLIFSFLYEIISIFLSKNIFLDIISNIKLLKFILQRNMIFFIRYFPKNVIKKMYKIICDF